MSRNGFTLMELLLVVIIIGIVYSLSLMGMKNLQSNKEKIDLKHLKEFLIEEKKKANASETSLICINNCNDCFLYLDNKQIKKFSNLISKQFQAYRFHNIYNIAPVSWASIFNEDGVEQPVCFRYDIEKNNISDELIITHGKETIWYSNFNQKTRVFSSIDEVIDIHNKDIRKVLN